MQSHCQDQDFNEVFFSFKIVPTTKMQQALKDNKNLRNGDWRGSNRKLGTSNNNGVDHDEEDENIEITATHLLPELVLDGEPKVFALRQCFTHRASLLPDNDECKAKGCIISYVIIQHHIRY